MVVVVVALSEGGLKGYSFEVVFAGVHFLVRKF